MPSVREILQAVDEIAPFRYAFSWDRVGLQLGDPGAEVHRVLCTLDISGDAIDAAIQSDTDLIVSHHPLIWDPLKSIRSDDATGALVWRLAQAGISVIAAHTNWDSCPNGLNDWLAAQIGLTDVQSIGSQATVAMVKLVAYVPNGHREALVDRLGAIGAGAVGLYERCAFWSEGTGTFRPLVGAKPAIGKVGLSEEVAECRVEMLLRQDQIAAATHAIRTAHPYEEPAFEFVPVIADGGHAISRIGRIPSTTLSALCDQIERCLQTRCRAYGPPELSVTHVAVCGGAASDEWQAAQAAGAQALVTGEVKHAVAKDASNAGFALIEAGHYATEGPSMKVFAEKLATLTGAQCEYHAPIPGVSGRPSDR